MESVERVLKDGGVSTDKVDEIVLIGGSTRIPAVQVAFDFSGFVPNADGFALRTSSASISTGKNHAGQSTPTKLLHMGQQFKLPFFLA